MYSEMYIEIFHLSVLQFISHRSTAMVFENTQTHIQHRSFVATLLMWKWKGNFIKVSFYGTLYILSNNMIEFAYSSSPRCKIVLLRFRNNSQVSHMRNQFLLINEVNLTNPLVLLESQIFLCRLELLG